MAAIQAMERGTLCRMAGRPHYNHQTWRDGRNVSRYVPRDEVASLRKALAGYRRFMELAQQYADLIIARTRDERARARAAQGASTRKPPSPSRTSRRPERPKDV